MTNLKIIMVSILSLMVGIGILNGTIQEYITFAGPENELGCAVISLSMGVLSLMCIDWRRLGRGIVEGLK
jgi:hypothetical protein